jgi:hypothetical protein
MTTKKKSRPLFEVPAEVESGAQSGWVYRSGGGVESSSSAETSSGAEDSSIPAMSMATLSLALAAMTQAAVLGMRIATLPWTMGLRTLQYCAKLNKTS